MQANKLVVGDRSLIPPGSLDVCEFTFVCGVWVTHGHMYRVKLGSIESSLVNDRLQFVVHKLRVINVQQEQNWYSVTVWLRIVGPRCDQVIVKRKYETDDLQHNST